MVCFIFADGSWLSGNKTQWAVITQLNTELKCMQFDVEVSTPASALSILEEVMGVPITLNTNFLIVFMQCIGGPVPDEC